MRWCGIPSRTGCGSVAVSGPAILKPPALLQMGRVSQLAGPGGNRPGAPAPVGCSVEADQPDG